MSTSLTKPEARTRTRYRLLDVYLYIPEWSEQFSLVIEDANSSDLQGYVIGDSTLLYTCNISVVVLGFYAGLSL